MPLGTQVIRDGEPLKLNWSHFHVAAMAMGSILDSGIGPFSENTIQAIYGEYSEGDNLEITPALAFHLVAYHVLATTPLNSGKYTMKSKMNFRDTSDGEIFTLMPGDILTAYRS